MKKRRSCKLLAEITGYSRKHISKLRMKGLTDQQISYETKHYNRQYPYKDGMYTVKQLAHILGYSIPQMGARIRNKPLEEALMPAGYTDNRHSARGGWGKLPQRSRADQENALAAIPGPTRFDKMYG